MICYSEGNGVISDLKRSMRMSIAETLVSKPPPLRLDGDGNLLVGGTRVPLDTVVGEYEDGASAEEIVRQYDSLRLPDVHAVISYYLEHRSAVEQYLAERRQLAEKIRSENEARFSMTGIPPESDAGVRPIWQVAAEILRDVPEEELQRLPIDLAGNLGHYIYGAPKKQASVMRNGPGFA
jgi:uncharacterized protein (DUF433 family)